ncbi:MAG: HesA/MoeB/ThiF family protein [Paludibacteraceae bacterium]|nr:HesA/MoeB/ThiF family protein [Paludibacteraceae bacterium]
MLTIEEKERFLRHIIFKDVGIEGQEKLKDSSVLVIGAGGLGSPVLLYLAAAGVGRIGIVDDDIVSIDNLQRQILYKTEDIGLLKCQCAAKRLLDLNPNVDITTYNKRLDDDNCREIVSGYDIVVDATDNMRSRYVISGACCSMKKIMVHGSVCENKGYVALLTCENKNTSYEALFPNDGETEPFMQPTGIIGTLPGIIGTIQAMTTVKYIIGIPVLVNQLLVFDAESMDFLKLNVS